MKEEGDLQMQWEGKDEAEGIRRGRDTKSGGERRGRIKER